uniref:WPP domain-containing protein n=1 Tax=Populus alba TaxID=43335 RepID=A0A4U5NLR9_POPAL|nr:hypothetical protein D5086_0000264210 [Populus alba]
MLLVRVTDNLTTKSIFTQKYGSLSKEEAEENAKRIEDVAFATANEHYEKEPDGDGSSAVQLYAKECSKLISEVLKRGPKIRYEKEVLASDKVSAPRDTVFDISKGARVAGPILASIKDQLKEVDLSDFIAGRPEAEAFEVMNIFSTALEGSILKSLNLRIMPWVRRVLGLWGTHQISEVGCEGGIALSKALKTCTHLKKLDLRDNMFGKDAGVALSKALSKYAGLREVYLSYLNLEDEGDMSIASALKESAPSPEVLDMAGNDITAEAAPIVAACIAEKQHLTKLNLAENELRDEGTIQISKVLEESHLQLKEVDMSNNSLGRSGARVLAKVPVQKPEFKYLNINGNFISDEGIDEVNELFEKFPDRLGSVDENDPEGGGDEEESGEGEDDEHELERKLENLEANKDE